MIRITPSIAIDEQAITESFVRASGPGGQNVNKVATAVQLRFDPGRLRSAGRRAGKAAAARRQAVHPAGNIADRGAAPSLAGTQPAGRAGDIDRLIRRAAEPPSSVSRRGRPQPPGAAGCRPRRIAPASSRPGRRRRTRSDVRPRELPATERTGYQQHCQNRQQDQCGDPMVMRARTAKAPVAYIVACEQHRHRSDRP